jgi:hypothetical protein
MRANGVDVMPSSLYGNDVQAVFDAARTGGLFASPEDWRDLPIYFLMVDRFNGKGAAKPANLPFDASFNGFQGGGFAGVQSQLKYIKDMGFGAIWLSPVLQNRFTDTTAYHGYGIQNFLTAEPRFATNPASADDELRALVDAAHEMGLYIIFDIVLHHAGDVFAYLQSDGTFATTIPWQSTTATVGWRDAAGKPGATSPPPGSPRNAVVWPSELQDNKWFTEKGNAAGNSNANMQGDFDNLKGFNFDPLDASRNSPLGPLLIRAYQYVIARFDVDAFRIDSVLMLYPSVERTFANAMREFALSAGKKNFFSFGEIWSDEATVARFIGRNTQKTSTDAPIGIDAALDYPLFYKLPGLAKGLGWTPNDLAGVFQTRRTPNRPFSPPMARPASTSSLSSTTMIRDSASATPGLRSSPTKSSSACWFSSRCPESLASTTAQSRDSRATSLSPHQRTPTSRSSARRSGGSLSWRPHHRRSIRRTPSMRFFARSVRSAPANHRCVMAGTTFDPSRAITVTLESRRSRPESSRSRASSTTRRS